MTNTTPFPPLIPTLMSRRAGEDWVDTDCGSALWKTMHLVMNSSVRRPALEASTPITPQSSFPPLDSNTVIGSLTFIFKA